MNLAAVRRAAETIAGEVVRTPCLRSPKLSALSGAEVYLKLENEQLTGSFKERGALTKLRSLDPGQRRAGVVAMSAGNHAQAVARWAQHLGIPATVVMPRFTPNVKVEQTRSFGAEVLLHGEDLAQSQQHAEELVQSRRLVMVHPYDDELIIAGQGTIALEMLADVPQLDTVIAPVGGGGLIAGIASAAKELCPDIQVIGVQAARFPAMAQALRGDPIQCGDATLAEGIAVKRPGKLTVPIVERLVDDLLFADEAAIEAAVLCLLEQEKTVVEGAGAAALAALLEHRSRFTGRHVGLVISGGNLDLMVLSQIIERGLVRSQRLVRLAVAIPDRPGGLAEVSRILAAHNANIIHVRHQRAFTHVALRSVEAEFVLQTLGEQHAGEIVAALRAAGYEVEVQQ
ncbi:MAG TPA: threonine ammonia-lyase [Terriglobales bacterium]|nr:threonine ammonia-lyase [Terriglobales bacterium]